MSNRISFIPDQIFQVSSKVFTVITFFGYKNIFSHFAVQDFVTFHPKVVFGSYIFSVVLIFGPNVFLYLPSYPGFLLETWQKKQAEKSVLLNVIIGMCLEII